MSDIERKLLDVDDVLEVEDPSEVHLDGHREHDEEQVHAYEEAHHPHLFVETPEERLGEKARQRTEIEEDEEYSRQLALQPERRERRLQPLDPEDFRDAHVVQRNELVRIPVFVRAEEVPVRSAQERPEDDEDDPQ